MRSVCKPPVSSTQQFSTDDSKRIGRLRSRVFPTKNCLHWTLTPYAPVFLIESSACESSTSGSSREDQSDDMKTTTSKQSSQFEELLGTLKARFEKNMNRHKGLEWAKVQPRLEGKPQNMRSLTEIVQTR